MTVVLGETGPLPRSLGRPLAARWQPHSWLYYRLYVPEHHDTQKVVQRVVDPARRHLTNYPAEPSPVWFFLRYLDLTGMHVRLRMRPPEDRAHELERHVDALLIDLFDSELPGGWVDRHVYEPETAKWGGSVGVLTAEPVFAASSGLACDLAARELWPLRHVHGLVATAAAVLLLDPVQREGFLHHYSWYWCGGGSGTSWRPAATGARSAAARIASAALAAAGRLVHSGELPASFATYLSGLAAALGVPGRSPSHLLFNHIHLTNNRLGVSPREEAVLAEILRTDSDSWSGWRQA